MKKVIGIIILLLLLILVGFRVHSALQPAAVEEETRTNVRVAAVERGSISTTSLLTGRISAADEAAVVPLASGEVNSVRVALGDYVKKGSVLFTIDSSAVSSSYTQAKLAYDNAVADLNRYTPLYEAGAISKQAYDGAKLQVDVARSSLNAASEMLSNYTVKAPISGYITGLNVSVGSVAGGAPALYMADTKDLELSVSISEYLISSIHVGDSVDIYISSLSEEPFRGTVTQLSPAPAMGTLTYPATIAVENPDGSILAGMFAEVRFVSAEQNDVIAIPSDAVFVKNGVSLVAVLDSEQLPVLREVVTGMDNGELVEIVSGLSEGETLIVKGQQYVTEGKAVNIVE